MRTAMQLHRSSPPHHTAPSGHARFARAVAACLIGLALATTAACTGDGDDRADRPSGSAATPVPPITAQSGPTTGTTGSSPPPKVEPTPARPTAPAPPPATGPADTARLTAALLAEGELPGVDYQVTSDDRGTGWLTPVSMNTDPPECAVFAQESIHNAGAPVAWSHQEYRGAAPGGMAMGVTLSSHRDDAGARLLADLDRALAPCATGFTVDSVAVSSPKLWTVAPVDGAPMIGDETLAYRIDVLGGGGNETVTVVLIRFGPTVAHFVYRGNAAPDTAPYAALIAGQVQKARAQLGR